MINWDNSAINFFLQTGKWMREKENTDLLPESISLIRKLTGAYTTLQIIFEDAYTARIKNAMPLFLDDFIFDPSPIKTFLERNQYEPVYWKSITDHDQLFSDILLALSSAVLIPVCVKNECRLIIIGWSEPQNFTSTFHNFVAVVKTRLEELWQKNWLTNSLQKDNRRYNSILNSLPQALVYVDEEGFGGWINKHAATLLHLENAGYCEADILAAAMANLRNHTQNQEEINRTAAIVFAASDSNVNDWVWEIGAPVNKQFKVACISIRESQVKGKLWIFEEQ